LGQKLTGIKAPRKTAFMSNQNVFGDILRKRKFYGEKDTIVVIPVLLS